MGSLGAVVVVLVLVLWSYPGPSTRWELRMRVETKDGGDGVQCWNRQAIRNYANTVDEQERQLAGRNPDLKLLPGLLKCYGCEVMEHGYGTKCTATLTRTRYGVNGEIEPRAEDAAASLAEVPGLLTRAPDDVAVAEATPGPDVMVRPTTLPQQPQPVAHRKLFGRSGR